MAPSQKTCPAEGCTAELGRDEILCAACWQRVPAEQRADVERTREQLRRSGNARWARMNRSYHIVACSNAIKAAGRRPEAED